MAGWYTTASNAVPLEGIGTGLRRGVSTRGLTLGYFTLPEQGKRVLSYRVFVAECNGREKESAANLVACLNRVMTVQFEQKVFLNHSVGCENNESNGSTAGWNGSWASTSDLSKKCLLSSSTAPAATNSLIKRCSAINTNAQSLKCDWDYQKKGRGFLSAVPAGLGSKPKTMTSGCLLV